MSEASISVVGNSDPIIADFGVSVIMPYHREDMRMLENLRRLMHVAHVREILCVSDGCSWVPKSEAEKILSDHPDRKLSIRFLRNVRGKGVSGARNTGLEQAGQSFVCFLDYDDIITPERFSRDAEHFSEGSCDITICEFRTVFESTGQADMEWKMPYANDRYSGGRDFFNNSYLGLPHLTCFTFRKEKLLHAGIRFDEALVGSEDTLFKYTSIDLYGFITSPGLMAVSILRHSLNTTVDMHTKRLLESRLHFFKKFSRLYDTYPNAHRHFQKGYFKNLKRYIWKRGDFLVAVSHVIGYFGAWFRHWLSMTSRAN